MTKKTRKINRQFESIPVTLDEVLESLTNSESKISSRYLAELSDLSPENLKQFKSAWLDLSDEIRIEVISRLAGLAEDNVELNFDAIFKLGLDDEDEKVRCRAVKGLWESNQGWVLTRLLALLGSDSSPKVRIAAAQALERFCLAAELQEHSGEQKNSLAGELLAVFNNNCLPLELRRRALEAVSPLNTASVHQAIRQAYLEGEPELKISALYGMGASANPAWLPFLIPELSSENPEERYEAASACGQLAEEDAVEHLLPLLQDEDIDVQMAAISALGKIGGSDAREALRMLTEQSNKVIRDAAVQALYELELYQDPFSPGALKLTDFENGI